MKTTAALAELRWLLAGLALLGATARAAAQDEPPLPQGLTTSRPADAEPPLPAPRD